MLALEMRLCDKGLPQDSDACLDSREGQEGGVTVEGDTAVTDCRKERDNVVVTEEQRAGGAFTEDMNAGELAHELVSTAASKCDRISEKLDVGDVGDMGARADQNFPHEAFLLACTVSRLVACAPYHMFAFASPCLSFLSDLYIFMC